MDCSLNSRCFLFAGTIPGDVLLCSLEHLAPSTASSNAFNKEHHRISVGCGCITSMVCVSNTCLLLGDSSGKVLRIELSCSVCSQPLSDMSGARSMDDLLNDCNSMVTSFLKDAKLCLGL